MTMITDDDIKKLAQVFATKDDLQTMEANIRKDMATKKDLNSALEKYTEGIVNGVQTIIEMLGDTSDQTEKNRKQMQTQQVLLHDHEDRIRKLEQAI